MISSSEFSQLWAKLILKEKSASAVREPGAFGSLSHSLCSPSQLRGMIKPPQIFSLF